MAEYFLKEGEEFVSVKDPLHTQAEVDSAINYRLQREREKFADYPTQKEKITTLEKDLEEKSKAFDTEKSSYEDKLKKANLETEKIKIVHEFNLSDDLVEFVGADEPDEMRKRAEKLAKGIKPPKVTINKEDKPENKATDSKNIAKKLFGNKSDD